MDSNSALQLVILILLLVLSGFFSSAETSLTTVSTIRLFKPCRARKQTGSDGSQNPERLRKNAERHFNWKQHCQPDRFLPGHHPGHKSSGKRHRGYRHRHSHLPSADVRRNHPEDPGYDPCGEICSQLCQQVLSIPFVVVCLTSIGRMSR